MKPEQGQNTACFAPVSGVMHQYGRNDFLIGLGVHTLLLVMMLASVRDPDFQFWPPPSKDTWQYHLLWWCVRLLVICIGWLIYSEHSSFNLPDWFRFYICMPLFVITFALGSIAAFQLGWRNTHGEAVKFVNTGFYKYSRNPQYVLYSISFLCLGFWASSVKALILLALLAMWYLRAPFLEEQWLEQQYGESYLSYKRQVSRYFGWSKNA